MRSQGVNTRMKMPELKIPGLDLGKSEIDKYLSGVNFPAQKTDLIRTAREKKAPDAFITTMERIPDRSYSSTDDVISAFTAK